MTDFEDFSRPDMAKDQADDFSQPDIGTNEEDFGSPDLGASTQEPVKSDVSKYETMPEVSPGIVDYKAIGDNAVALANAKEKYDKENRINQIIAEREANRPQMRATTPEELHGSLRRSDGTSVPYEEQTTGEKIAGTVASVLPIRGAKDVLTGGIRSVATAAEGERGKDRKVADKLIQMADYIDKRWDKSFPSEIEGSPVLSYINGMASTLWSFGYGKKYMIPIVGTEAYQETLENGRKAGMSEGDAKEEAGIAMLGNMAATKAFYDAPWKKYLYGGKGESVNVSKFLDPGARSLSGMIKETSDVAFRNGVRTQAKAAAEAAGIIGAQTSFNTAIDERIEAEKSIWKDGIDWNNVVVSGFKGGAESVPASLLMGGIHLAQSRANIARTAKQAVYDTIYKGPDGATGKEGVVKFDSVDAYRPEGVRRFAETFWQGHLDALDAAKNGTKITPEMMDRCGFPKETPVKQFTDYLKAANEIYGGKLEEKLRSDHKTESGEAPKDASPEIDAGPTGDGNVPPPAEETTVEAFTRKNQQIAESLRNLGVEPRAFKIPTTPDGKPGFTVGTYTDATTGETVEAKMLIDGESGVSILQNDDGTCTVYDGNAVAREAANVDEALAVANNLALNNQQLGVERESRFSPYVEPNYGEVEQKLNDLSVEDISRFNELVDNKNESDPTDFVSFMRERGFADEAISDLWNRFSDTALSPDAFSNAHVKNGEDFSKPDMKPVETAESAPEAAENPVNPDTVVSEAGSVPQSAYEQAKTRPFKNEAGELVSPFSANGQTKSDYYATRLKEMGVDGENSTDEQNKQIENEIAEIEKPYNDAVAAQKKEETAKKRTAALKKYVRENKRAALASKFVAGRKEGGAIDFWLHRLGRLLNRPGKYEIKNIKTGKVKYHFDDATFGDALDVFFDGMNKTEKTRWGRILFGGDSIVAPETNGDIVLDEASEFFGNPDITPDDILDNLRSEWDEFEAWQKGDKLTADEERAKAEAEQEAALQKDEETYWLNDAESRAEVEKAYNEALVEVNRYNADSDEVQAFSTSELSKMEAGDTLRFDHAGEEMDFVSYKDGVLTVAPFSTVSAGFNANETDLVHYEVTKDGFKQIGVDNGRKDETDAGNVQPRAEEGERTEGGAEAGNEGGALRRSQGTDRVQARKELTPEQEALRERVRKAYRALVSGETATKEELDDAVALFKSGVPVSAIDAKDFEIDDFASWPVTGTKVASVEDAAHLCQMLSNPYFEVTKALYLDKDGKVVGQYTYSYGVLSKSSLNYMKIAEKAPNGTYGVVLSHNHPAGKVNPSEADVMATEAAKIHFEKNGIKFIDHIITDTDRFWSMNKNGTGFINAQTGEKFVLGPSAGAENMLSGETSVPQPEDRFNVVPYDERAGIGLDKVEDGGAFLRNLALRLSTHETTKSAIIGIDRGANITAIVQIPSGLDADGFASFFKDNLFECERFGILAGSEPFDRKALMEGLRTTIGRDSSEADVVFLYSLSDDTLIDSSFSHPLNDMFENGLSDDDIFRGEKKVEPKVEEPKYIRELRSFLDTMADNENLSFTRSGNNVFVHGKTSKDTYSIKDQLKKNGFRFHGAGIKAWAMDYNVIPSGSKILAKIDESATATQDALKARDEAAQKAREERQQKSAEEKAEAEKARQAAILERPEFNKTDDELKKAADSISFDIFAQRMPIQDGTRSRIEKVYKEWVEEDIPDWVNDLNENEAGGYAYLLEDAQAKSGTDESSLAMKRLEAFEKKRTDAIAKTEAEKARSEAEKRAAAEQAKREADRKALADRMARLTNPKFKDGAKMTMLAINIGSSISRGEMNKKPMSLGKAMVGEKTVQQWTDKSVQGTVDNPNKRQLDNWVEMAVKNPSYELPHEGDVDKWVHPVRKTAGDEVADDIKTMFMRAINDIRSRRGETESPDFFWGVGGQGELFKMYGEEPQATKRGRVLEGPARQMTLFAPQTPVAQSPMDKAMGFGMDIASSFFKSSEDKSFDAFVRHCDSILGDKATSARRLYGSWYTNAAIALPNDMKPMAEATGEVEKKARALSGLQARGKDGVGHRVANVVQEHLMPTAKEVVTASDYNGGLDEDQRKGVNLALASTAKPNGHFMLADGTGFGKTRQILAIADQYEKAHPGAKVLIVTKSDSILKDSFRKDSAAMGIDTGRFTMGTYNGITSGKFDGVKWDIALFDEAHLLSNPESQRTRAYWRMKIEHKVFATATPMDRPTDATYFMAELNNLPQEALANQLGYRIEVRANEGEDPYQVAVPLQGQDFDTIQRNVIIERDKAIASGKMIRRAYPFLGDIEMNSNVPMADEHRANESEIVRFFDDEVAAVKYKKKIWIAGRNGKGGKYYEKKNYEDNPEAWNRIMDRAKQSLRNQKYHALDKLNESMKANEVAKVAGEILKRDPNARIIIVGSQVGPQTISGGFAGEKQMKLSGFKATTDRGIVKYAIEPSLKVAARRLAATGFGDDIAHIYSGYDKTAEQEKFLSGQKRILVMTAKSGGTGVNLDDTTGNHPTVMLCLNKDYSAKEIDQLLGRVSRKNTKSEARVLFVTNSSAADAHKDQVANQKLGILKAIQGGADLDIARGMSNDKSDDVDTGELNAERVQISEVEDAAYMDAVKRGDMETARRMVREAAAKAMPNTKVVDKDGLPLVVYHGTGKKFTVFDKSLSGERSNEDWGSGIYLTDDFYSAKHYASESYLTLGTWGNSEDVKWYDENFDNWVEDKLSKEDRDRFDRLREQKNRVRFDGKFFDKEVSKGIVMPLYVNIENPMRINVQDGITDSTASSRAQNNGYDGIIVDGGDEIVVFTPSIIKSADPVTYDDAGNVIPLSERFNLENDSILYADQTPIGDYGIMSRRGDETNQQRYERIRRYYPEAFDVGGRQLENLVRYGSGLRNEYEESKRVLQDHAKNGWLGKLTVPSNAASDNASYRNGRTRSEIRFVLGNNSDDVEFNTGKLVRYLHFFGRRAGVTRVVGFGEQNGSLTAVIEGGNYSRPSVSNDGAMSSLGFSKKNIGSGYDDTGAGFYTNGSIKIPSDNLTIVHPYTGSRPIPFFSDIYDIRDTFYRVNAKPEGERVNDVSQMTLLAPQTPIGEQADIAGETPDMFLYHNAAIDQWRADHKLNELARFAKVSLDELNKRVSRIMSNAKEMNDRIQAIELLPSGTPVSAEDQAMMGVMLKKSADLYGEMFDQRELAKANNNEALANAISGQMAEFLKKLERIQRANQKIGNAAGRALQARQFAVLSDYTLAGVMHRAMEANNGRPLTDDQRKVFEELTKDLTRLGIELDDENFQRVRFMMDEAIKDILAGQDKAVKAKVLTDKGRKTIENEYRQALLSLKFHGQTHGGVLIGLPRGKKWLDALQRWHLMNGEGYTDGKVDEKKMVDLIVKDCEGQGVTATDWMVRQELSQMGLSTTPPKSQLELDRRELNTLHLIEQQMAFIEKFGELPPTTGYNRDTPTLAIRELRKRRAALIKEKGLDASSEDSKLKSALDTMKTRLKNRIEELENAVATGKKIEKGVKRDLSDAEVLDLRARLDQAKKLYDEAFPKSEDEVLEAKVIRTMKALAHRRDEWKALLEMAQGGNFDKETKDSLKDPRLDVIRGEIDAIKAEWQALKDAAYPDGTEAERAKMEEQRLKTIQSAIDDVDSKLSRYDMAGTFNEKREALKKSPRKEPFTTEAISAKKEELKAKRAEIDARIQELADQKKSAAVKAMDIADTVLNVLPRALRTMGDFSQVLSQGLTASIRVGIKDPKAVGKALKDTFRAFASQEKTDYINNCLAEDLYFQDFKKMGGRVYGDVTAGGVADEFRGSERKIGKLSVDMIPGVKASERSFGAYLNAMNVALYKAMIEGGAWDKGGPTEAQRKELAGIVSTVTGSSSRVETGKMGKVASILFFAPRFAISTLKMAALQPIWKPFFTHDKDRSTADYTYSQRASVSKEAAKVLLPTMLGVVVFQAILNALLNPDDDEEKWQDFVDPRSSDFLSARVGNARVNLLKPITMWWTLAARLATGESSHYGVTTKGRGVANVIGQMERGKLSPIASYLADLADGKTYVGDTIDWTKTSPQKKGEKRVSGAGHLGESLFTPMFAADVVDLFKNDKALTASVLAPAVFFGARVASYDDAYNRTVKVSKDKLLTLNKLAKGNADTGVLPNKEAADLYFAKNKGAIPVAELFEAVGYYEEIAKLERDEKKYRNLGMTEAADRLLAKRIKRQDELVALYRQQRKPGKQKKSGK